MITDANAATSTAPLGSAGRERACSGAAAVPPANQPGGEVLRILLVEDSAFDLEIIRDILRGLGRELRLAAVATRAGFEAELKRELPQLILSDYSLPGFDGITVLQIAQELAPEIPFVFVTGTLGEEVAIEMLKLGATDYVLKERLFRLAVAVRRALADRDLQRVPVLIAHEAGSVADAAELRVICHVRRDSVLVVVRVANVGVGRHEAESNGQVGVVHVS